MNMDANPQDCHRSKKCLFQGVDLGFSAAKRVL